MAIPTINWVNGCVKIIDQRQLPNKFKYIYCRDLKTLWQAIKTLSVRGAPALGVAAAFGVVLGVKGFKGQNRRDFDKKVEDVCRHIASSRPTAVNLFNALASMKEILKDRPQASVRALKELLKKEAFRILNEDKKVCRQMAQYGQKLIKNNTSVLTICNAGALATVDYGTALGVMYAAKEEGKNFKVYACETRPLLQGARLTAWELKKQKIKTTLICDNMAATLMKQGQIDLVITGADRIAASGDTANKIGTYNMAVLAYFHKIPFYIAAPFSTFDLTIKNGRMIPIEQRDSQEVTFIARQRIAPRGINVYNPAFDVTDHTLIRGIITEHGIISPPFKTNIKKLFSQYVSQR